MIRYFRLTVFGLMAYMPLSAHAQDESEAAPLPPAARRVLEDAEKAVARNRKAFEAANEESLNEAEKALKQVMEDLTKQGKLEEALATKNLIATFREQVAWAGDGSSRPKVTDLSKRKPQPKPAARSGKAQMNEQFGFADEQRVNEWWEFDEKAKDRQLGSDGVRLNHGGTMQLRAGLVGDFELGIVVKQHVWHWRSVLRVAGVTLDIGENDPGPSYRLVVVRKGNQLLVNKNGTQSVLVISADEADKPQYPSISSRGKVDVRGVAIKAMKVEKPTE